MAIIHFINYRKAQSNAGMKFVLNYTMQDKKTVSDDKKFVSGINCTPTSAYTEFRNTKKLLCVCHTAQNWRTEFFRPYTRILASCGLIVPQLIKL